jgi:hypothetical protein
MGEEKQATGKMIFTLEGTIRDKDGNIKEEFTEVFEREASGQTKRIE